jgi:pilus assembly protein CpaC
MAVACLAGLLAAQPAAADILPSEPAPTQTIHVAKDKSFPLTVDGPVERIVLAQPDTAEVAQVGPHSVYVTGKAPGETNLLVYGPADQLLEVVDVRVGYDAAQLQSDLAAALPDDRIEVRNLGEGLLMTGEVSTPAAVTIAKSIAQAAAPDAVTSQISVREQQVLLEVRLIEASVTGLRDAGVDLDLDDGSNFHLQTVTGLITANTPEGVLALRTNVAGLSVEALLGGLEQKGVVHMLARPNLVAMSGQKASFQAGGEFPYPVPQGLDQITLEFRSYGVSVNMVPVIENGNRIRLHVRSELSALDPAHGLTVNNIQVPGLTTRRVDTLVSMRDGQSVVVGGLLSENVAQNRRQVPWLGDLPHVGWLFRSADVDRQRTEFAVVVTAHIVSHADLLQTASDIAHVGTRLDPSPFLKRAMDTPWPADGRDPAKAPVGPSPPRNPAKFVVAHVTAAARTAVHLSHLGWTKLETWAKAAVAPRYAARDAAHPADS